MDSQATPLQVQWFEQQTLQRRVKRSLMVPTDPWFFKQWYMVSSSAGWVGKTSWSPTDPESPCLAQNDEMQPDLNILQVWSQGLTGQGIVVSVLDDGIEKDHPDLWANYVRHQSATAAPDPMAGSPTHGNLTCPTCPHISLGPPGQLRLQ